MTLIAGVKCDDGFLVAADTAVTVGEMVHHGEKVHFYRGSNYKIFIACCGYLSYAKMASEKIRDGVGEILFLTDVAIRERIKEIIERVYSVDIALHHELYPSEQTPHFSLIVALELDGKLRMYATEHTTIHEVEDYHFDGTGSVVAEYVAATLLRNTTGSVLACHIGTAVHLIIEIFNIAKRYGSAVGLDTHIFAFRTDGSYQPFFMPLAQTTMESDIALVFNNLKSAIWGSLERGSGQNRIDDPLAKIASFLNRIKAHTETQGAESARLVEYKLAENGNWSVSDLQPNMDVPPSSGANA
jgi:hypothetical protein